jgi:hypothetical protein
MGAKQCLGLMHYNFRQDGHGFFISLVAQGYGDVA